MSNGVMTSFHEFINKFYRYGIYRIKNENILALTQQIYAVYERLDEAKKLPHETPAHVLTRLNKFNVNEFVEPFESIISTERVNQMVSDGAKVDEKRTLKRLKILFSWKTIPSTL